MNMFLDKYEQVFTVAVFFFWTRQSVVETGFSAFNYVKMKENNKRLQSSWSKLCFSSNNILVKMI